MSKLPLQPLDIARETLRELALRRIPPTPDSFRELYHKIAGTTPSRPFPDEELRELARRLPRNTPERLRLAAQLERAAEQADWNGVQQALLNALPEAPPQWAPMLGELLRQLDLTHQNLTRARKLTAISHVLGAGASNPERLFARLDSLTRSWLKEPLASPPGEHGGNDGSGSNEDDTSTTASSTSAAAIAAETGSSSTDDGSRNSTHWLAALLRQGVQPLLADDSRLADEARALADAVEQLTHGSADPALGARLHSLGAKLEWTVEDQRAVRSALLGLLRLIVDNIGELVIDDRWLHGQVEALGTLFERPLDIRALDELERKLRDVIDKQKHLKRQLTDAQAHLKSMLAGFVGQLAELGTSTGNYQQTLADCAERLRSAEDVGALSAIVEHLVGETLSVQETTRRSSEEIHSLREQVEAANSLVSRLQRELDETSTQIRHDPLTGVLNRKGLDDALQREITRARRREEALCVCVLDLDNFKKLNDTFGHRTGDDALRHLTEVARASLRPQDSIGRLGGEEFLILLPDADEEQAARIVTRLQRALTTHIFLAQDSRILITFSAGVARLGEAESPAEAIDRADKAMYAAKRAGKNRVLVAGGAG